MEFNFEDEPWIKSEAGDDSFLHGGLLEAVGGNSCTYDDQRLPEAAGGNCCTCDDQSPVLGISDAGQDALVACTLPDEELFVSVHASIRTRGYRELEQAFKNGSSAAWRYLPWFREMLLDSDEAAFLAACAAVTASCRCHEETQDATPAQPTWLAAMAEGLLRHGSREGVAVAGADLVAVALQHHGAKVWSLISGLLQKPQTSAGALRLLQICAGQGVCCAEEVWPMIREAALAALGPFSSACVSAGSDVEEELVALLQLLPSIDAKLSAELGIQILPGRSQVAWEVPAQEDSTPSKRTSSLSRASLVKSSAVRLPHHTEKQRTEAATEQRNVKVASPSPGTPSRTSADRGGWQWDDRLAASPVPPAAGPADCDALHVLSTASPRSWRKRLQCLKEIDGADGEGLHGLAVLPQLVLQAEDSHPAIAAAALQAIVRVAHHLEGGHVGEFLAERLAIAIRSRLRGGRARRCVEASAACLTALIRHSAIATGRVDLFMTQALGCTREAARAVVAAFHEEGLSTPRKRCGTLRVPAVLEELLQAAVSPRRAARRPSLGTPCRPNSRPSSRPCTPQKSSLSTRLIHGPSTASPWRSPSLGLAGQRQALSPLPGSASLTPTPCQEQFQDPVLQFPLFVRHGEEEPGGPAVQPANTQIPQDLPGRVVPRRFSPSLRTPPRYAQRIEEKDSPLQAAHGGACSPSTNGLLAAREAAAASHERRSTLRAAPHDGACKSRLLVASASAPLLRPPGPWQQRDSKRDAWGPTAMPSRAAWGSVAPQEQSTTSLAGPRLYADSQLLSPSRASLGGSIDVGVTPACTQREQLTSTVPLHSPGELPSFPAGAFSSVTPSGRHAGGDGETAAAELTMTSPVPWVSPIEEPASASPREEKSFLVSPPSTSNVRVRGLCTAAAAGLHALETGGDPAAWHDALRALAAWEPGADGVRGEAAAEAVVELLLDAAPRLRGESLPEIWRALGELRAAPWLSEVAVLELAVGHCLSFTAPAVVAAFLVARISEGRLTATACLESCLERLLETDSSKRVDSPRLASLLNALMETIHRDDLRDLLLPSFAAVVEWASPRRLAANTGLRAALEMLLRHVSPACMSEQCWEKLLENLHCTEAPATDGPTPLAMLSHDPSPSATSPAVNTCLSSKLARAATPHGAHVVTSSEAAAGDGMARLSSSADQGDVSELATMCSRMHRLTGELARVKGPEVADVLQMATQLLSRPQTWAPLRAFLRRLLARQRSRAAAKENAPPPSHAVANGISAPATKAGTGAAEIFLDNDFASVRELASDEGLAGSFPHSLLVQLKRLLAGPAAAGTHRAALECLGAMLTACGMPLLRVILRHFAGSILHLAATRGPAQTPARTLLTQLVSLNDRSPAGSCTRPRLLRMVCRALGQAVQPGGSSAEAGDHAVCFTEMLRWLGEDALSALGGKLESSETRELLFVVAPGIRDRSSAVRSVATRTLHALAQARGGGEQLREDVHDLSQLAIPLKAAVLSALDTGPPPTPAVARTPSTAARTTQASDLNSPMPHSGNTVGSNSGNSGRQRRGSTSRPRRLRFTPQVERSSARRPDSVTSPAPAFSYTPSPLPRPPLEAIEVADCQVLDLSAVKHSPPQDVSLEACSTTLNSTTLNSSSEIPDLEQELIAWHAELSQGTAMDGSTSVERAGRLHSQLEQASLHHGVESGTLIPATLNVLKQLVHAGAAASASDANMHTELSCTTSAMLLEAALAVARAANATFSSLAVSQLCSTAAVTSFRAVLQSLARLQQLAKSSLPWAQRAAAPLLLELPPVLACIIDKMEAPVQLVAWMRVAGEVLEEEVLSRGAAASNSAAAAAARRWALRFCTRCVDRCAAQVPLGSEGFPAWDVLSEVLRFHERRHLLERPGAAVGESIAAESDERSLNDGAWQADCDAWGRTLESTARLVARQYRAQAREFLLLAACTGSSMPQSFERLLEEA